MPCRTRSKDEMCSSRAALRKPPSCDMHELFFYQIVLASILFYSIRDGSASAFGLQRARVMCLAGGPVKVQCRWTMDAHLLTICSRQRPRRSRKPGVCQRRRQRGRQLLQPSRAGAEGRERVREAWRQGCVCQGREFSHFDPSSTVPSLQECPCVVHT